MSPESYSAKVTTRSGIGDIISRAWRLYRLNFSKVILYALIPGVIIVIAKLLMNLPYATASNDKIYQLSCLCFCPTGIMIFIFAIFVSLAFNFAMFKFFFNNIVGKYLSYVEIIESMKRNLANIFILSIFMTIEIVAFAFFDFVLFFMFYTFSAIPFVFFAAVIGNNSSLWSTACVIIFIYVVILVLIYLAILGVQFLFISLQLAIYSIEKANIAYCIGKSIRVILQNPLKSALFICCLWFLWYCMAIFFQYPISIIVSGISIGTGLFPEDYFPAVFIIFNTLWVNIVNILLWPFIISSISLFYYNIRVTSEGLDLHQMLTGEHEQPT